MELSDLEVTELDDEIFTKSGDDTGVLDKIPKNLLPSFIGFGDHIVD